MKNKILLILFCIVFSEQTFSQQFNFKNDSVNKIWFSAGIGGHLSCFVKGKQINAPHGGEFIQPLAGFWI